MRKIHYNFSCFGIFLETEREELEQTVALGNTNLEALQAEYRCLMHSWNSVVVAIGNRDRIVECLRTEVRYSHQ